MEESNPLSANFHEDPPAKIPSNNKPDVKKKRERIQRKEKEAENRLAGRDSMHWPQDYKSCTNMDGWVDKYNFRWHKQLGSSQLQNIIQFFYVIIWNTVE